jgi:hypothetical protein
VRAKHRRTLAALFRRPTSASIPFTDLEALIVALGGEVREGEGSRVALELDGKRRYLHRPHPGKAARKYQVEELRQWLEELGIQP